MRFVRSRARRSEGQSLVEFSLVITPLLLILLGIIQMGFVFNAQVTITNAAREGARAATIYVYSSSLTKGSNDAARNAAALDALTTAFGTLSRAAPQFTTGSSWTVSGTDPNLTYTNGDVVVSYSVPSGVTDSEPRTGERVTVRVAYHQDLFIPMIASLLPKDAGGRLAQTATITMVIN